MVAQQGQQALAISLNEQAAIQVQTKNKPHKTEWVPRDTITLAQLKDYKHQNDTDLTPYGGLRHQRREAMGFFRVEEVDGVWWIIDPDGGRFISKGVNSVNQNRTAHSRDAILKRFGGSAEWARETKQMLLDRGFNTLGCWSDLELLANEGPKIAYTLHLRLMSGFARELVGRSNERYENGVIPVFEPGFADYCDQAFAVAAERYAEDPWVLGFFSDNELPLRGAKLTAYLQLDRSNANGKAAHAWWEKRRGNEDRQPTEEDESAFLQHVCETYFQTVIKARDKHLTNHLYLGSRLIAGDATTEAVMLAGREYVDIWSVNYYWRWTPRVVEMNDWVERSGRPFMITEWYAKGMDSGLNNSPGAGWVVQNQADRGKFYQNFTLHLLSHYGNVGWHWFKYVDSEITNRSPHATNAGIVNADYRPYDELHKHMAEINLQSYRLRAGLQKYDE